MRVKAGLMGDKYTRSEVFCDFFTITTPKDLLEHVITALQPYFLRLGCSEEPCTFRGPDKRGTFSYRTRHKVAIYAASGGFVGLLRDAGILNEFLAEFYNFSHNVSSADFTVDEYRPAPVRVQEIYDSAMRGEVSFTRKAVNPSAVTYLMSRVTYDDSGLNTGTVYIGRKGNCEVRAKVYDKRQQMRQQRTADIRDTLRHEVTVSGKMGITLRDIAVPHDCFYHFYPENLLSKAQFSPWVGVGEGFRLEKPPERIPAALMKRRVETSLELKTMIGLAVEIGEDSGLTYLFSLIRKQHASYLRESTV